VNKLSALLLMLVLCAVSAGGVFAQDAPPDTATDETTLTISGNQEDGAPEDEPLDVFNAWDFIRMALILAAVVAVIYGIFFILKKTGGTKFQETRLMRVLSSKALAGSRALHLVEVGNQIFLIGTSDTAVNLVSEILDKETLDGLRLQAAGTEATERKNFGEILSQVFNKSGISGHVDEKAADAAGFLKQQRQRVKNM
jgi:flagellar protein FliO/FliZ